MAEVNAFRGWRYDVGQVGALAEVVAPPYDVISPAQQEALYKRHPCNVVRLILNRKEPGDESPDLRYARAAEFLRHWQSEGVIVQERQDALYVYHQIFDWEGTHYVRRGFIGRLRLENFGSGSVYPHEQTMSGPKADRLALMQACRMNLSPIFGLYPDPQAAAQQALENVVKTQSVLEVSESGVVHRFWSVTDHNAINRCREAMRERPIFIADGHHRYETACNYRDWLQSQGRPGNSLAAEDFVLMHFVGMSDPGLAILPTHRLVAGLPELRQQDVQRLLSQYFEVDEAGTGEDAALRAWDLMQTDAGPHGAFAFGTTDGGWLFARLRDASVMANLAPERSEQWRQLGVSVLHGLVLDKLFGDAYPHSHIECSYVHLMDEVASALADKSCQLACLVAPAGISDVEQIASQFEKMPPKSTFFYPKLLSGLVFNPLT